MPGKCSPPSMALAAFAQTVAERFPHVSWHRFWVVDDALVAEANHAGAMLEVTYSATAWRISTTADGQTLASAQGRCRLAFINREEEAR